MKYLKRFNEGNITPELTTEMVDELRSFCRDHLAYLIDEDFKVQVVPLFDGTSCDIVFFKQEMHSYGYGSDVAVKWSSIKDRFIPFLYMLNKEYNIIDAPANERMFLTIQPRDISDIISEKRLHSNTTIRRMRVRVEFKDQSITEAVSQDTIELCCVDLFDDGFELKGYNKTGKTIVQLVKDITSSLPEDQTLADNYFIIDEHTKNYRQGTITITGKNFDNVTTTERPKDLPFTDKENKLISQVSDAANLLSHYSSTKGSVDRVVILITNRGLQNPMNFQYERYITQINILFYV